MGSSESACRGSSVKLGGRKVVGKEGTANTLTTRVERKKKGGRVLIGRTMAKIQTNL